MTAPFLIQLFQRYGAETGSNFDILSCAVTLKTIYSGQVIRSKTKKHVGVTVDWCVFFSELCTLCVRRVRCK